MQLRLRVPPRNLFVPCDAERHPAQFLAVLLSALSVGGDGLGCASGFGRVFAADGAADRDWYLVLPTSGRLLLPADVRFRRLQQSLHVTGSYRQIGIPNAANTPFFNLVFLRPVETESV